jgi:hypothetical protein
VFIPVALFAAIAAAGWMLYWAVADRATPRQRSRILALIGGLALLSAGIVWLGPKTFCPEHGVPSGPLAGLMTMFLILTASVAAFRADRAAVLLLLSAIGAYGVTVAASIVNMSRNPPLAAWHGPEPIVTCSIFFSIPAVLTAALLFFAAGTYVRDRRAPTKRP